MHSNLRRAATYLILLLFISGCSVNRTASSLMTDARFKPLDSNSSLELIYEPSTRVVIDEHSEFFLNLDPSVHGNYKDVFIQNLTDKNISLQNEPARYVLKATDLVFIEQGIEKCILDSNSGREDCYWLNKVEISLTIIMYDHELDAKKRYTSSVSESTKLKKRFIVNGYKEGGYLYRKHDYLSIMINECFAKTAGKAAKYIKKKNKKSKRLLARNARKNKSGNSSSLLANQPAAPEFIQSKNTESTEVISAFPADAMFLEDVFFDDRNNQQYSSITYSNNQQWMGENLKAAQFQNGDTIVQSKSLKEWKYNIKSGIPSWASYNFSDDGNSECGKLYNWFAVIDDRNLAPNGWHVATESEWRELSATLGEKEVANKLKSSSDWNEKSVKVGNESPDGNGNNESGLNCMPCGQIMISQNGGYQHGWKGGWWFPRTKETKPRGITLNSNGNANYTNFNIKTGHSIRCVKD